MLHVTSAAYARLYQPVGATCKNLLLMIHPALPPAMLLVQVLAGSVMVFVTAGYSGKRFIFEKAHSLGVKSIVLDAPDRWAAWTPQTVMNQRGPACI